MEGELASGHLTTGGSIAVVVFGIAMVAAGLYFRFLWPRRSPTSRMEAAEQKRKAAWGPRGAKLYDSGTRAFWGLYVFFGVIAVAGGIAAAAAAK